MICNVHFNTIVVTFVFSPSTHCCQEAKEKQREASHAEEFSRAELNKVLKRVKEVGTGNWPIIGKDQLKVMAFKATSWSTIRYVHISATTQQIITKFSAVATYVK